MPSRDLYLPPTGWVRRNVVLAHVPFGTTKLDDEIRAGRFPAPQSFGARMVAWDAAAVHAWIVAQRDGRTASTAPAWARKGASSTESVPA